MIDILPIDDQWVIRRPSACQDEPKTAYLFWTGGMWRYDLVLAMKFSSKELATNYLAKSADRMASRAAFTRYELRRIDSASEPPNAAGQPKST
jgi:hypothetical protein